MDAGLQVLLDASTPFALRLAVPFRGLRVREGMAIRGPAGWGEFAPFDDYDAAAAGRWLAAAIEAAFGSWPEPARRTVTANAILAADAADACYAAARRVAGELGCRVVKMQVGAHPLDVDESRVAAVRRALDDAWGPGEGRIRLDAKARWSPAEAARALGVLAPFGLEYAEQPCATADELRALRGLVDVPIAADESIRLAGDPGRVRVREFADIAILKPQPLGGVGPSLRLAASLGVPVVFSGSLDSSVGLDAVVRAAACVPQATLACGVGTGALLADDLVVSTTLPRDGLVEDMRHVPDAERLREAAARMDPTRVGWWRTRLAEAWGTCPPDVRRTVKG